MAKSSKSGVNAKPQSISLQNTTIEVLEKEAERRGITRSKLVDSILQGELINEKDKEKPTVIAVMSYKGGVAKTTTSASLALCLAESGHNILIIDLDGQGNISQYFRQYDNFANDLCIADVMYQTSKAEERLSLEDVIRPTDYNNVSIVPSNFRFADADAKLKAETTSGIDTRLRFAIEDLKETYDYIIIDCGPRLDMTTTNAIIALEAGNSNSLIIIPVKIDGFAVAGVSQTIDIINRTARERRMPPQPWKILKTVVEKSTSAYRVGCEELKKTLPNASYFNTFIEKGTVVPESSLAAIPLIAYANDSKPAFEYRMLAEEIENMQ